MQNEVKQLQQAAPTKKLLVIGDVMLDVYVEGAVHRNSPEAPVPVLSKDRSYHCVGGAANVSLNLNALGAQTTLLSVVGDDADGELLSALLDEENIEHELYKDTTRQTTVKKRFMNGSEHLLRVDSEDTHPVIADIYQSLLAFVSDSISDFTGIVISDYDKGLMAEPFIKEIISIGRSHNLPIYVDPKYKNFWSYAGCSIFKPNLYELQTALAGKVDIQDMMNTAHKRLQGATIVCTQGAEGMHYRSSEDTGSVSGLSIDVTDVSGAGDTALAMLALADQCRLDIKMCCDLAKTASGQVCTMKGVASVSLEEVLAMV